MSEIIKLKNNKKQGGIILLKNQVKTFSVGAKNFLTDKEREIYREKSKMEYYCKQIKEFTVLKLIQDINDQRIKFIEDDVFIEGVEVDDIQLSTFLKKFRDKNITEKVYKRNPTNKYNKEQIEERNDKYIVKLFQEVKYYFTDILDYIQQVETSNNSRYIRRYVNSLMKINAKVIKNNAFKELMSEIDENYIKLEQQECTTKKGETKTKTVDVGYKGQIKARDSEFKELIKTNKEQRTLQNVSKYSIIAVFESDLTRMFNIKTNELSEDLITVTITYYPIMKQLLDNGFIYKGEKYIYFSSSSNQIKTKKMVFMKESVWNEFQKSILCGLTIEDINNSTQEGCNINKFLAYTSLISSASDRWERALGKKFNIDECIVIPDFDTTLKNRTVDYIEKTRATRIIYKKDEEGKRIKNEDGTWKTKTEEYWLLSDKADRRPMDITIEHSDGCGWILPSLSKKNFQFRLNWMKGLLTPVDFLKWCEFYNNGNYKVKDIYGDEWDLKEDNIKIIFFKSQFKMHKYYKNWEDYKTKFKENHCQANICNMEDDKFKYANFNYQMWQTLEECDPKVIDRFIDKIDKLVTKAYIDKKTMLKLLGATKKNKNRNYLQEALIIYPELLQDFHIQEKLSDSISKIRKESSYGKFQLDKAHYTYLIPDIWGWLQFVFKGEDKVTGLLKDGEVYCKLFDTKRYNKLLVNRSPHLYKEHCVRKNVTSDLMKEWYITDGVYTSCKDMISRMLQFDNDGDKSLVIGDDSENSIIKVAEENMKDILPLYYEMGKSPAKIINSENIYDSLVSAFSYGNIGEYSNKLTKLWNYKKYDKEGNIIPFTEQEKEQRLNLAKIITCQNNFSIDASKTLEMVEISDNIKKQLNDIEKYKLPYFFRYKKNKDKTEVEEINDSTVNIICQKIEGINQGDFDWDCVGKLNYHKLMNNWKIDINTDIAKKVIEKYKELNEEMQNYFKNAQSDDEEMSKERIADIVYKTIYKDFRKFYEELELDITECVDIIVKHIYKTNRDCKKSLLFNLFGYIIVTNLKNNLKETKKATKQTNIKKNICPHCGKDFIKQHNKQKYCSDKCKIEAKKQADRERQTKKRATKTS